MDIANQFKGLPMEDLIGAPLTAAVKSNVNLAKATAGFINEIGFEQVDDGNGNIIPGPARMVDFLYERPGTDAEGNPTVEEVKLKVPILAIVPVPNLQVDLVDITFDMEVKSATSTTEKSAKEASFSASGSAKYLFFSVSVSASGSVSTSRENTRSTDKSAKYHVQVQATNHGIPEGLARVLDIMHDAAQPRQVKAYQADDKGELPRGDDGKPTGEGVLLDADGNPIEKKAA
ncbi:DUF2589 domain-containing protein [Leptobacterium flavescens]|uniref:DUF2589 domain-containing protein n=1 Tax=Leptobacterium flavescens TaxID=472055 RepID=A0A6P0UK88_9FLAO|nr:DUF2589 domain-containing protein [Leptobacterium flavescens]NER13715.1 DUF2589 domain-containing protein [Leptobacterium flavescens]